jgi:hypothetical protein
MNETSQSTLYHRYLKGEHRVDGFQSSWLRDFKKWREDQKGKPTRVSAVRIKVSHKSKPRYCADCPHRLSHNNTCGYCKQHTPKVPRLKIAA